MFGRATVGHSVLDASLICPFSEILTRMDRPSSIYKGGAQLLKQAVYNIRFASGLRNGTGIRFTSGDMRPQLCAER